MLLPTQYAYGPLISWLDSGSFVQDVFEAIAQRSYLPGYKPPKKNTYSPSKPLEGFTPNTYATSQQELEAQFLVNASRKRPFDDQENIETAANSQQPRNGHNPYKQARIRGGSGRQDYVRGRPVQNRYEGSTALPGPPAPQHSFPGSPVLDRNEVNEILSKLQAAEQSLQAQGMAFPHQFGGAARGSGFRHGPRRRNQCREFAAKGFCKRGLSCQYEHNYSALYVPQPQQLISAAAPTPHDGK